MGDSEIIIINNANKYKLSNFCPRPHTKPLSIISRISIPLVSRIAPILCMSLSNTLVVSQASCLLGPEGHP